MDDDERTAGPPRRWVRRRARVAAVGDAERVVVTDPARCDLHVLAGSAAVVWSELDEGTTVEDVATRVARWYPDVDPETVAGQVAAFLGELAAAGLVEVEPVPDTRTDRPGAVVETIRSDHGTRAGPWGWSVGTTTRSGRRPWRSGRCP
ncbi:PqqD family protein [Curtobacterium sp. MCBD17_019]|uniref:PqqD family protein n=1 Tax=Curtobacterium sp. MCBD17_019 TaxID=2175669 RepID=UPI0015E885A0|nr:PqqD family protein [Curtobacterium sp. MCBD17_019]